MKLSMAGINFHSAPVELREQVAFSNSRLLKAIDSIAAELKGSEVALLSTCNRTELYIASPDTNYDTASLSQIIARIAGVDSFDEIARSFYGSNGLEAAEHLISVASSLDSMVVGETEILGQVKQAYMSAIAQQPECKMLHTLFQHALKAAKRVHSDTDIARGRVSVSSIAIDFTRKIFDGLAGKTAMIVGAGETGELTLRRLLEKGVKNVLVVNRSLEKAQAVAAQYGGRAIPFDLLEEFLPQADIVISSTSAPHCVITEACVKAAIAERHDVPMLFIDIAVPRDIEEAVGAVENAYLYNIDDLQKIAEENMERRSNAIEAAKIIVKEEAAELSHAFGELDSVPLINQLEECTERIRNAEVARILDSYESLSSLTHPQRQEMTKLVHQVVSSILADPKRAIVKAEQNGNWAQYSAVVRDLFRLEGRNTK